MKYLVLSIALLQWLSIFSGSMSSTDPDSSSIIDSIPDSSNINGVSGLRSSAFSFPFEERYKCSKENEESVPNQVSTTVCTLVSLINVGYAFKVGE